MDDAETEERELEETESLLEYYLQRAANTQSEAERLLAGARDLEESIGVSLSARRFEVCAHVLKSTRSPTRAVAMGYHNRSNPAFTVAGRKRHRLAACTLELSGMWSGLQRP